MIPLPFRVAHAVSGPLRTVATLASGYTLQTLGLPVVIEGHTLLLEDHQIAIAEACNGLSMLFVFAALATAVAIVSNRTALDRILILLSAVPIAIVANVFRITLTALAYRAAGKEWGDFVFHDLAGWLMTPLALVLLWLELRLLDLVLVPIGPENRHGSAASDLGALLLLQGSGPQTISSTASSEKAP
jgi:exosortase